MIHCITASVSHSPRYTVWKSFNVTTAASDATKYLQSTCFDNLHACSKLFTYTYHLIWILWVVFWLMVRQLSDLIFKKKFNENWNKTINKYLESNMSSFDISFLCNSVSAHPYHHILAYLSNTCMICILLPNNCHRFHNVSVFFLWNTIIQWQIQSYNHSLPKLWECFKGSVVLLLWGISSWIMSFSCKLKEVKMVLYMYV